MDKKNLEDVNHVIQLVVFVNPDLQFFRQWDCSYLSEQRAVTSAMVGLVTFDGHKKTHPPLVIAGTPNKILKTRITGWWFGTFFLFHFIYGMSSFPTDSYFSQR